ncbi:MAG TPA: hypothetical protein VGM94_17420 [Galbitalea sp.]|jgi:hypothetical protein
MTIIAETTAALNIKPADDALMVFNTSEVVPTPIELDHAEQFANFTIKVEFMADDKPVSYEPVPDIAGMLYRFPGTIRIRMWDDTFMLRMLPGSTEDDVDEMKAIVEQVRSGLMRHIPFQERTRKDGRTWWWLAPGFMVKQSRPARIKYPSYLTVCDDADCDDTFHLAENNIFFHNKDLGLKDLYLERPSNDVWNIQPRDDWESFTVAEAIGYANDLQWAAAEALKLNQKRAAL